MDLNKRSCIDKHSSSLQALALDLCFSVLDTFFKQLDERLAEELEVSNQQQQWQILALTKAVQADKNRLSQLFENEIMEGFVQFRLGRLNASDSDLDDNAADLSLLATDDLERDLAISSMARRAETRHMESLFSLTQRLSVVNGGKKLTDDGNPLAPSQFAKAFAAMLMPLELNTKFLVLFSRVFEPVLIEQLQLLYEKSNRYLIEEGMLPNLRYSISKDKSAVADQKRPDSKQKTAHQTTDISDQYYQQAQQHIHAKAEEAQQPSLSVPISASLGDTVYQQRMFNAIRQLQDHAKHSSAATVDEAHLGADAQISSEEIVSVLNAALDKNHYADALAAENVSALTIEHYQAVARNIQASGGGEKQIVNSDRHSIDLVGMIFEYMLGDELLPDSVKAVLSYLHTPFLKLALSDPQFFESAEHPARQLLNLLADTGKRWVNSDGESQFQIFPKIKSIVRRAVTDKNADVDLYNQWLLELQEFHLKIQHKLELLDKRTKEKAQGEEHLRESKRRVYYEIKKRIGFQKLPAAVTVLLLHPWADYLTFELLRFGIKSKQWKRGLEMVDDILWSLLPKHADDCSRLILMQSEIKQELTEAIKSISFNQPKALNLLAILEDLQNQVLDKAGSTDNLDSTNVETFFENRIAGSEEFVEAVYPEVEFEERDETLYSAAEKAILEQLKQINFGTQFEFDELNGHHNQRLKVAWYNLKTMRYMLVDNAGRKVTMASGIEISRLILAKHARILSGSSKPFFERALENILLRLKGVHV